jgi:transitional endoplasmic reticulum ATPase
MQKEIINNLLEAIALSPSNIPLRLQVASLMLGEKMYDEAAVQFGEVLKLQYGNIPAQLGLADCFFNQEKFSPAIVIYEQLQNNLKTADRVRFVRSLIRENSLAQAIEEYNKLLALEPGFKDEEIDARLRIPSVSETSLDEEGFPEGDGSWFMEKPAIRFKDVGGMQKVKGEISIKIIQPLTNPDLYKAFGKKTGGGILLYGPPGCGKTFIAKATAGEINAKFINIGLHDILDMWIGNSEKNLHEIFELARRNKPCVLFFDEVDAMGASRSEVKQSAMRHVINQFLAELDGVESDNDGVLILAATNAPWSVDAAFRRPGRFDRIVFVEPPDETARLEILRSQLEGKPLGEIDLRKIALGTAEYSGADIKAIIDIATEEKLRASMLAGTIQPLTTKDLLNALKLHRATTLEWFASARNYALYANESGLYDDILKYLKIRK